jgi:hypothetical protein
MNSQMGRSVAVGLAESSANLAGTNRPRLWLLTLLTLLISGVPSIAQTSSAIPGFAVGQTIPTIEALDKNGHLQTFDTLKGKNGLLLLFSRSADWLPYCKMHLLQVGKLLYQACDDHQCYSPVQQPVSWNVQVLPFDRVRSQEAIQHKD